MVGIGMLFFALSSILVASPAYSSYPVVYALVLWLSYSSLTFSNLIQSILWKKEPINPVKRINSIETDLKLEKGINELDEIFNRHRTDSNL